MGKGADPDGYIYKSSDEIEEETGLTYDEQKTARKKLVQLGFIEEYYARLEHQIRFRVIANAVNTSWASWQCHDGEEGNPTMAKAALPKSLNGTTETTPETTTENTLPDETIYEDCDDYGEPIKGKKKPKQKPEIKKLYPIAAALSEVTGMSFDSNKEKIFREAKYIVRDPRVTAEEIKKQFSPGGDWYRCDWRGQKGQRPILTQVRETIFTFKEPGNRPEPKGMAAVRAMAQRLEAQENGNG